MGEKRDGGGSHPDVAALAMATISTRREEALDRLTRECWKPEFGRLTVPYFADLPTGLAATKADGALRRETALTGLADATAVICETVANISAGIGGKCLPDTGQKLEQK